MAESTPVSTPTSDVVIEDVRRIVVELFVDDERDDIVLEFAAIGAAADKWKGGVVEVLVDVAAPALAIVFAVVPLLLLLTWGRFMVELPGLWVEVKATGDRQQRPMSRVVNPFKSRLIST